MNARTWTVDQDLLNSIEAEVNAVEREYKRIHGLILTEDDLKSLLYCRFSRHPRLEGYGPTQDPDIRANRVHCEVSWFDSDGKLTIKPDITVLDPQYLTISRGIERPVSLPSKGFGFAGDAVIFELKFVRQKSGITQSVFEREIKRDWDKIQRLFQTLEQQRSREAIYCFFIIFAKSDRTCGVFDRFLRENAESSHHKILYRTGQVF